jgi:Ser-tRNA(Ala) deacylase AlaX
MTSSVSLRHGLFSSAIICCNMKPTKRLYWEDDHILAAGSVVLDVREHSVALDQICFYPGGGGQPPDHGALSVETATVKVNDVKADADGLLWHCCEPADSAWEVKTAVVCVDEARRSALSRHHLRESLSPLSLRSQQTIGGSTRLANRNPRERGRIGASRCNLRTCFNDR